MPDLRTAAATVFPQARAQTTQSSGSQEDSFLSDVVNIFDGLKVQIELADFEKKLSVADDRTAAVLSLKVHDCRDRMLFGVILEPVKSALWRNARYQINAFKVFIEGSRENYGGPLETINRGDAKTFADAREELQNRVGDMIADYYRASNSTQCLAKAVPTLIH